MDAKGTGKIWSLSPGEGQGASTSESPTQQPRILAGRLECGSEQQVWLSVRSGEGKAWWAIGESEFHRESWFYDCRHKAI